MSDGAPAPGEGDSSPFSRLGGEPAVVALAEAFYDAMEAHEPALTRVHSLDAAGHVDRATRDRFALFLVGWFGGPARYMATHGHPRLRMRHGHVPIDAAMRDAWLRSMQRALDAREVRGLLRSTLDTRFEAMATHLLNRPG